MIKRKSRVQKSHSHKRTILITAALLFVAFATVFLLEGPSLTGFVVGTSEERRADPEPIGGFSVTGQLGNLAEIDNGGLFIR